MAIVQIAAISPEGKAKNIIWWIAGILALVVLFAVVIIRSHLNNADNDY